MRKKLLDILVCPQCKSDLDWVEQAQELVCKRCELAYPVRESIPVLLIDEARPTGSQQADSGSGG